MMRTAALRADTSPATTVAGGEGFLADFLDGLAACPKRIPSKYFYDEAGSALFDRICELPEYYPTRTETALLERQAQAIAQAIGPHAEVVEFGAGALTKASILLDSLKSPRAYVPIDISGDYLNERVEALAKEYPDLAIAPMAADFTRPMELGPLRNGAERRIGFFPGSTIGNFLPEEAATFLQMAARLLKGGGLLIGVDIVKDPHLLHAAYNDAAGVTAAFNKNLVTRANRELGADFDPDRFVHHACYNPRAQRIEMYLVSRERQVVRVAGQEFLFGEGEAVLTEYSHKYTAERFRALAVEAGFLPRAVWFDPERLFSIHWLEAC